jgi:hypothetical protein
MNRNITAIILVVLAIGIYFTVTKGILADAGAVQSVNNQYIAAIASAQKLIAVRDQVLKDYNNISADDRDRLTKMLPQAVDNIRLVIDLNGIALKHGFSLKGISASAAATQNTAQSASSGSKAPGQAATAIIAPVLDTVNVSFGLSAPYDQFQSFLQDLESNLRVMDITHLALSSSDNGIYNWNIQLKTYWLRTP